VSLTGDPATDALVPIAQQFVGAVRDHDGDRIEELLAEAIVATGGRCDPALALLVVCAAMVPEDLKPSALLAWRQTRDEFLRLTGRGVSSGIARQLMGSEGAA
jgi:hypothetical protein